ALPGAGDIVGAGERIRLLAGQCMGGVGPFAGVVFTVDVAVVDIQSDVLARSPAIAQRAGDGVLLVAVIVGVMVAVGHCARRSAVPFAVFGACRQGVIPAGLRPRQAGGRLDGLL